MSIFFVQKPVQAWINTITQSFQCAIFEFSTKILNFFVNYEISLHTSFRRIVASCIFIMVDIEAKEPVI